MKINYKKIKILIVDIGKELFEQVRKIFKDYGTQVCIVKTLGHAFEKFEETTFDVLIINGSALKYDKEHSIELLETISDQCSTTQLITLARKKDILEAFSALKTGSCQYSRLPIENSELKMLVDAALYNRPQFGMNFLLKESSQMTTFHDMIGASSPMKEVYKQIRQAAMTDIPVLISGETGTGKDLVANAIHETSQRKDKPFIPIHLGALPNELVASELFGHEKGAFTGAFKRHVGSFEKAKNGTVFLDEIGTIDHKNQISLLRLLETKAFNRIGGTKNIKANVRVIAATNEDLTSAVSKNRFREDLLYRLDIFSINLPPLHQRYGDISLLMDFFLKRFNDSYKKNIMGISPECISLMESYKWPGNVRELKNIIHRAVVMCTEKVILPEYLPKRLLKKKETNQLLDIRIGNTIEESERIMISATLNYAKNNKSLTAKLLGISRRALYNKIEKYDF